MSTVGEWGPSIPSDGCKSWHVTRRNPKFPMGVEYLCGPFRERRFRTREAAQKAADERNRAS
jgi:hypothetical protein